MLDLPIDRLLSATMVSQFFRDVKMALLALKTKKAHPGWMGLFVRVGQSS